MSRNAIVLILLIATATLAAKPWRSDDVAVRELSALLQACVPATVFIWVVRHL